MADTEYPVIVGIDFGKVETFLIYIEKRNTYTKKKVQLIPDVLMPLYKMTKWWTL